MNDKHIQHMRTIHAAKRNLRLSDEDYRRIVREIGEAASGSAKDLSDRGACAVLDHFRVLGWCPSKRGADALAKLGRARTGMATQKQLAMLLALWGEAARTPSEAAFNHFLSRFGVSHYRFLPMHKVSAVKAALESMKEAKASTGAADGDVEE